LVEGFCALKKFDRKRALGIKLGIGPSDLQSWLGQRLVPGLVLQIIREAVAHADTEVAIIRTAASRAGLISTFQVILFLWSQRQCTDVSVKFEE
jgi:hypothetical protein